MHRMISEDVGRSDAMATLTARAGPNAVHPAVRRPCTLVFRVLKQAMIAYTDNAYMYCLLNGFCEGFITQAMLQRASLL